MAEIIKYGGGECLFHIKHDMRELASGKDFGNESIDRSLSDMNYSLVDRGNNASEVNAYRKALEKEIFHYNRKDLVHAIEVVIQCPSDCPAEQKEAFFRESYNYICSRLPMGERCVFVAEVHRDERKYVDGINISKDHLHVMYTPAVRCDKHEGYKYKLCADELTKRKQLKEFHPGLQKHLDDCGIRATVYQKKEGVGRTISLSVKELKDITERTGVVLNKTITVEELASIVKENENLRIQNINLLSKISELEKARERSHSTEWGRTNSWGTKTKHWEKVEEHEW